MKTPPAPDNCLILPRNLLACAASDKVGRDMLTGALVDAEKRLVVVCNGRAMAMLPIPGEAAIKPCYITPAKFKAAKATLKKAKDPLLLDFVAGTLAGLPLDEPDVLGTYPNYYQVIPDDPHVYRAILDPALLLDLASSLGHSSSSHMVEILFPAEGGSPFTVKLAGVSGILMPGHLIVGKDRDFGGLLPAAKGATANARLPEHSDTAKDAEIARLTTELHLANEGRKALAGEAEDLRGKIAALATGNASTLPNRDETKPKAKDAPKEIPLATGPPVLTRNEERNGLELRFDGKPDDTTLASLKSHGFRWCPGQPGKPWVARYSEEKWIFATSLAEGRGVPVPQPGEAPAPAPAPTAPGIHTAVIHGGESITPKELAKRLMSGRDGKIPTPAELAAERAATAATDATPPSPQRPKRILPDF